MCGDHNAVDLVFASSPASSAPDTELTLEFFRQVAEKLDIRPDRIHVGLVPRDCSVSLTVNENAEVVPQFSATQVQRRASTADVLQYLRTRSFSRANGGRDPAAKIAVLVLDQSAVDGPNTLEAARRQAVQAREVHGIEVFVVGVGGAVTLGELSSLASPPALQHTFHVDTYEDMERLVPILSEAVCPGSSTNSGGYTIRLGGWGGI